MTRQRRSGSPASADDGGSWMSWSPRLRESESNRPAFLIANANGFIYFPEEDLAVANFAGGGSLDDGVDYGIDECIFQHELQLYFGQEIGFVLPPSVGLGVPFLPSVTAHFRDRHTVDAEFDESVLDLLKPVGLHNRFEFCHLLSLRRNSGFMQEAARVVSPPPVERIQRSSTGDVR